MINEPLRYPPGPYLHRRRNGRGRCDPGEFAGTLFAVQFEGRRWELPMDELTATIELGNFPPTVPVEWRGKVGRVVRVGDGWKWKEAR